MTKRSPHSTALTDALRRLGNPYARLGILDEDCAPEPAADFRPLTEPERAYVRRQENPYACLSIADEIEVEQQRVVATSRRLESKTVSEAAISQREFEAECRRIFRQYIPSAEKRRIRQRASRPIRFLSGHLQRAGLSSSLRTWFHWFVQVRHWPSLENAAVFQVDAGPGAVQQ